MCLSPFWLLQAIVPIPEIKREEETPENGELLDDQEECSEGEGNCAYFSNSYW